MKYICCLLLIVTFFLGGCDDTDKEKSLIGTWQEVNNPKGVLEFRSDHTGRAYWPDESGRQDSSDMKWELLKGQDRVAVITPPGPVNFTIKRDSLVAPNGVVLTRKK